MEILLMRHGYDDHSYIDGKNDTSLTHDGKQSAKLASLAIAHTVFENYQEGIDIRTSSKIRAVETSEILVEELMKLGVNYSITIDDNLRELYQGEMQGLEDMTHEKKIRLLEIGWEIFDKERKFGNHDYKYGSPDYSDSQYVEFNSFIAYPYGESQNELSERIRGSFLDTLMASSDSGRKPLLVAHRGTIRELINIIRSHNKGIAEINQHSAVEMSGWKYCELFIEELDDVRFSINALKRIVHRL